jgi:mono/diheme cytochrome c family protein/predicted Ser/Thr protein kinase
MSEPTPAKEPPTVSLSPGISPVTRPETAAPEALPAGENAAPPLPAAVAGYEVLAVLGRGGMGVVYKARQPGLKRVVALKMILAGAHAAPEHLARFRTEAEAVARLHHPNIVHVYEVGQHEGHPFVSLEYLEGGSLAQQLDGAPRPPHEAARLVETLARAVHHAHERGIVHRDLKPANVLLGADGCPKIADFGLAKLSDGSGWETASGAILGTPSYMAPEQASGKRRDVGPPADTYALGAILYELLTGRPPFVGESALEVLMQVASAPLVPPAERIPSCPPALEAICLKCLNRVPQERYESAVALAEDLRRFSSGELASAPVRPSRPSAPRRRRVRALPLVLAGLLVLAVGVGVGYRLVTRETTPTQDPIDLLLAPEPAQDEVQPPPDEDPRATRAEQILRKNCWPCHGTPTQKFRARLNLYDRSRLLDGKLKIVVPGDAAASVLVHRVENDEEPMPPAPRPRLSAEDRQALRDWIDAGAAPFHARPPGLRATPAELAAGAETVLRTRCFTCHGDPTQLLKGKLNLFDRAQLLDEQRQIVVPRDVAASRLIQRLEDPEEPMPPVGRPRVPDKEQALLRAWINAGALPFPGQ